MDMVFQWFEDNVSSLVSIDYESASTAAGRSPLHSEAPLATNSRFCEDFVRLKPSQGLRNNFPRSMSM
jgi:hypothetical protein